MPADGTQSGNAASNADYRDVPWWAQLIYWRSEWLRSLCTDAWSYRRAR